MKLEIVSIHNHGDQNEEYVKLRARQACDLGNYLVTDNTYTKDGKISNKLRHPYWFTSQGLNVGDYVFLYTRTGSASSFPNKLGSTTYKYYWGVREPLWNDTGDCAVLLELSGWKTTYADTGRRQFAGF
jgi:hypothetical protein